ncbi:rRNA biogenesis protein rrp5 [Ascosphaera acerosa]|nr:rRNA biogenesis protein rrp5 [Ascosphaera acerosa]
MSDVDADGDGKGVRKSSKKSKRSRKSRDDAEKKQKAGVKIEGLTYKRMTVGTKVLGQVTSINAHDIGLALPNNLTGYVPLTNISRAFSDKLEKVLSKAAVDEEDSGEDDESDDALDLSAHFSLGQYLRATVTATETDAKNGKKGKKHLELSIDPRATNSGLNAADLVPHVTAQAAVVSVEDHGIIMDMGMEDSGVKARGFMAKKEIPAGLAMSDIKTGSVFLCIITGANESRTVIKLSGNLATAAPLKKAVLTEAPTIQAYQPGTAAEILLTDVTAQGMTGKIMGMIDAVVDTVQSGACAGTAIMNLEAKYKIGSKIRGRIISTLSSSEDDAPTKLGFSILDHVARFAPTVLEKQQREGEGVPAISAIVPECQIVSVENPKGVYVKLKMSDKKNAKVCNGFVHISRLADEKVESVSSDSGPYKIGTTHEGRIIGFNAIDILYLLSFEKTVLEQPFLRLEDVTVGAKVKGKIERTLIGPNGIDGLIVSLADGITGLVPGMHMSDIKLQHPEKKFRVGGSVTARILSVDLQKRQLRLTLKKSLVNTEAAPWLTYDDVRPGSQSLGTIVNLQQHGAVVQFYGAVRGFLPVSEMSEAYITDPSQHFAVGQVVNVHCLTVDAALNRLVISCKDPATFTEAYKTAFENVKPGDIVSGSVFEKSADDVLLKLEEGGLVARLAADQIGDNKPSKIAGALSRIRVGQKLNDLVVLDIQKSHRLIKVSGKPSLKEALSEDRLPSKYEDVEVGKKLTGLVKNITPEAVYIDFLGGLTGMLPKRLLKEENATQPDYGFLRGQVIDLWVSKLEEEQRRFVLSMVAAAPAPATRGAAADKLASTAVKASNAVDSTIKFFDDLSFGRVTKARVISVKDTQVNVQLADNIQGRIDASELFDDWTEIKDRKRPLKGLFQAKQIIDVRVLGIHDARSHRYLPISHRGSKFPVYELCAKKSALISPDLTPLDIHQVKSGQKYLAFVNNISEDCLWVNISPNVRGRVRLTDISDDLSLVSDVQKNFPIGSALRVTVTGVDSERNHLDLTAKGEKAQNQMVFSDFSEGMIMLGRVTKTTDQQVLVQLSDTVVGAIGLTDMSDDYDETNPAHFQKNEVLRVCIVHIDAPNKRINLSVRPSRVLSSTLPVADREIRSFDDIAQGDILRGYVKRVADSGVFVALGPKVTAYIRVSDLSDSYLKEWQDSFEVGQLVCGRVVLCDRENNKLQLSLKKSVLDVHYKPPMTIQDLKKGQIVTGKVRKVEDFGAFVVIDGTRNLSGLAHRSEMADARVDDARKLYEPGDLVKAKILKLDLTKERISLGLKASYIRDEETEDEEGDEDTDMDSEDGGVDLGAESEDDLDEDTSMAGVPLDESDDSDEEDSDEETQQPLSEEHAAKSDVEMSDADEPAGLVTGGFNFSGDVPEVDAEASDSDSDSEDTGAAKKKRKHKKAEIQVDRTGDLDVNGPQTVADFERLLLGEPDSSLLWLKYMAFQLDLGEIDKARQIAERALKTITLGLDAEKLNIWVALLNLENTFGNDDTLEEVFKRACQYNDAQEIHERMISIYIQSDKYQKADELFQAMLKKKFTTKTPELFVNYATFLFDNLNEPERGRALLPRAVQSLPKHTHVETTTKFAQLEYRSPNGDVERGRTIFEGLLSSFPKRADLWNVLIDLEIKAGDADQVRRLFRRVLNIDNAVGVDGTKSDRRLKEKQAKFFFKKWLEWEEKQSGDDKQKLVDEVKARAADYVKALKNAKAASADA